MLDLSAVKHHPALEEIVDVLCNRTQNMDRSFFQVEAAYFLGKIASSQRATVVTKDRGEVPVNIYALALASSGYGKGHSISIIENEFMKGFKKRFTEDTFPMLADERLFELATERAVRNSTDQDKEKDAVDREFRSAGAFPFTFDSGTTPAVKQLRQKLLMAGCGSINMQIDEIGSNLIGNTEVLTVFLELYDQGMVKQKLTKHTVDNSRGEELDGKTPTNMLLFGTPSKLLDGSQTEEQFYSFLETGYARRCIFGYGHQKRASKTLTPEEVYAQLTQPGNAKAVNAWAKHFRDLADPTMHNWKMTVDDDVAIELLRYKIGCENQAEQLAEHEDIRKAEISHRYFKALKLAGAYAFVDMSTEVEMGHLHSAIKLVEESGKAFETILNREKAYVKLAKYIAAVGTEVTHADLHESLPFYGTSNQRRNELITLATAWGYKRHIVIKKSFVDGIEFFKGEQLQETDLNEIQVSYSKHWAYHYLTEKVPFDQLHRLTQAPDMHWANHGFNKQHRAEENVVPGFNMVAIDVDGGIPLATVHELLKGYKFLTYTTKRHTEEENRFRIIFPINYYLELDSEEYKEFMNSIMAWLPFATDESANQRSKKWMTFDGGDYHYNHDGEVLDVLDFIPKTSRNESYRNQTKELGSLDNLERWFAVRIANGNRNNQMIKYALTLVDAGFGDLAAIRRQVFDFNAKLNTPLPESELDSTVMVTVAKRFVK